MKPFDLEAAKKGAKLVTRLGRPVRIVCYDRVDIKKGAPILALVLGPSKRYEMPVSYFNTGFQADFIKDFDLFIQDD